MFVYEFMAGLVDTVTGTEEEQFDPHKHRVIHHPTTYLDTMIHLLKASIGAGVLAMPDAFARLGIVNAFVGVSALGVFATYCIHLLILAQYAICLKKKRGYVGYPKSMLFALRDGPRCTRRFARFFYYFVDIVLVFWQFGICSIYLVFVASNIKLICDFYDFKYSIRIHLCVWLVPTIITNLLKNLKLMTPISSASNIFMMLGLILVFFYLIEDDLDFANANWFELSDPLEIPAFIGTCLFAMEAVGVVLALEYNMENPKHFLGCCGLYNIGMVVIICMYLTMGMFGYLKYGDAIEASITLNLPEHQKKAQAAQIIFALAIFLTFPLQNFVAYTILWRRISKRLSRRWRCKMDYSLRLACVLVPWSVAVAMPTLGPFISLFGSLCLSLLAVVFPGIIDACVLYPDSYGRFHYKLVRDMLIIIIGLICLVSGVYSSILEILQELQHQ